MAYSDRDQAIHLHFRTQQTKCVTGKSGQVCLARFVENTQVSQGKAQDKSTGRQQCLQTTRGDEMRSPRCTATNDTRMQNSEPGSKVCVRRESIGEQQTVAM